MDKTNIKQQNNGFLIYINVVVVLIRNDTSNIVMCHKKKSEKAENQRLKKNYEM